MLSVITKSVEIIIILGKTAILPQHSGFHAKTLFCCLCPHKFTKKTTTIFSINKRKRNSAPNALITVVQGAFLEKSDLSNNI